MKVKTTKKPKSAPKHFSKQTLALVALSISTGLLTVGLLLCGYFTYYLWQTQTAESNGKITTLILQAAEGLTSPAPADPKTGKVYIPQARLVLPARDSTAGSEIDYRYSPAENEFPEELSIVNQYGFRSARSAMVSAQNMDDTFKEVPALQACLRGYQISFKPITDSQNPLTFTKKLSDGRVVHVYLDKGCVQTVDDFENYLKQIDSY